MANGLPPKRLIQQEVKAVYASGYVPGKGTGAGFWRLPGQHAGIDADASGDPVHRRLARKYPGRKA